MTSVKIPVLLSKYRDDVFTATVVDGPTAGATASTASQAVDLVRSFLRKEGKRDPDQYWPRIEQYSLGRETVRVRLFYRDGKRQFPASREMNIDVRYVIGKYADDSLECFLPDFDCVFHCPTSRELSKLIAETVRNEASQLNTRELIAATPPAESEIRTLRIQIRSADEDRPGDFTPTLQQVADPVFQRRRKSGNRNVRFRDEEVEQVLESMGHASVLLVGPAGCGKTSVAKMAAVREQMERRERSRSCGYPTPPPAVWRSSAENLIAGMQYLGEWEQRLEQVIAELDSIGGVLLVTSLIDLVRLGGCQASDSLAAFLMPYMRRGEVKLLSEATPEELDAARRLLPGLVECFQVVTIDPLSHDQTCGIADLLVRDAEKNHRLQVEPGIAETATRLFSRFMPYQSPPRGVVQLVSDEIDRARRTSSGRAMAGPTMTEQGRTMVDRNDDLPSDPDLRVQDVITRFTKLTGLPDALLSDTETLQGEQVREVLARDVVGQPRAVDVAVNLVLRIKAGLCDPKRPLGTFLFSGPTGVGKTQLAHSLADYLFGQSESTEKSLIRIDMSEFANWDAVDRLLMGADGEVANWIGRLRARPMSVVLFDEFEKASPEVHDCLLSAMDEGRITDRYGRTTTLCGSVVILTSNVGSRSTSTVGFSGDDQRGVAREIEHAFRPEFLNRIDEIVVFEPLSASVIEKIVVKELHALALREALASRGVRLTWNDRVVQNLAAVGFDALLGARPLQRAIEKDVVARIARRILSQGPDDNLTEIDLAELLHLAD